MAVGDVFLFHANVAAGAYLDCQPGASIEGVIHNVYLPAGAPITLERYDGSAVASIIFSGTLTGPSAITNLQVHCTNTDRLRVKNTHGSTSYRLAADGIVTK